MDTNQVEATQDGESISLTLTQIEVTINENTDPLTTDAHLFGVDTSGGAEHVIVQGYRPHLYLAEGEANNVPEGSEIVTIESGYESCRGESLRRVETTNPNARRQLHERYRDFQGDVACEDHALIDWGVTSGFRVPERRREDGTLIVSPDEITPARGEERPHAQFLRVGVTDRTQPLEEGSQEIRSITVTDPDRKETTVWTTLDIDQRNITLSSEVATALPGGRLVSCESEAELLDRYLSYLEDADPDILTGWSIGDTDIPQLIDRLEQVDAPDTEWNLPPSRLSRLDTVETGGWNGPHIAGRIIFDQRRGYKRLQQSEEPSYRLSEIANRDDSVSVKPRDMPRGSHWRSDPVTAIENELTLLAASCQLESGNMLIDIFDALRKFVGCRFEDALTPGDIVDMAILHRGGENQILPSKQRNGGTGVEGGKVFDAYCGIAPWVSALDFASLYPMVMATLNASPETKVQAEDEAEDIPTYTAPNGIEFQKEPDSIVRSLITDLAQERASAKEQRDRQPPDSTEYDAYDAKQRAVKVVMNALIGTYSWTQFRLYDPDIVNAVTATAQELLKFTRDTIQSLGFEVLYGDTDSCQVSLKGPAQHDLTLEGDWDVDNKDLHDPTAGDEVIEYAATVSDALAEQMNDAYDRFAKDRLNADTHHLTLEFETLYRRFLQAGKMKRYAGHAVLKDGQRTDSVTVVGFECERSDQPARTRKVQREVLSDLVRGKDHAAVLESIKTAYTETKRGQARFDEVSIPTGINKPIGDYTRKTNHVRGAEYANILFGTHYGEGDKPKRVHLSRVEPSFWTRIESESPQILSEELYKEFKTNPDIISLSSGRQFPTEFHIDNQKMAQKTLRRPLVRVLKAIDCTWKDVQTVGQDAENECDFV